MRKKFSKRALKEKIANLSDEILEKRIEYIIRYHGKLPSLAFPIEEFQMLEREQKARAKI